MKWTTKTLEELVDRNEKAIQTGPFGSQLHRSDYSEHGTPVVMPQDIVDDKLSMEKIVRIPEQMLDKLSRHKLLPGDVVYPRRGDLNKRVLIQKEQEGWLCGTGCIRVRLENSPLNATYFYYYLKQPQVVKFIENKAIGATMLNLNTSILKSIEVNYPILPVQRRIADILSAYDDLIENNNRRMALLEESIHLLYREWFVYLRFPGHERVKVVDGVPEGWRFITLNDLCVENAGIQTGPFGSQLHRFDYSDEGVPVVMPKQMKGNVITTDGIARIPLAISNRLSRHLVEEGDILYARRGDITRRAFISSRECGWFCGTGCLRLRPNLKVVESRFLFETLGTESALAAISARATGATMPNLSARAMKKVAVLMPTMKLQSEFTNYSMLAKSQVWNLQEQNRKLREARDLLLPRLMDGRIPV